MANSARSVAGGDAEGDAGRDAGGRAVLPMLFGIAMVALFVVGLVLGSGAVDDYTYFAGLALAGFSLFVGARYASRYLP